MLKLKLMHCEAPEVTTLLTRQRQHKKPNVSVRDQPLNHFYFFKVWKSQI